MSAPPIGHAAIDFGRRLSGIREAVEKDRLDTMRAGGMAAKRVHAARIRRDAGGDSRLSGVGRRGARVGARFDIRSDQVVVRATGPLHFLAHPTSAHRIPRAGGRKRLVAIPGVGVRAWARHPGTRGKDTWNRAKPESRTDVTKEMRTRTLRTIKRAF